MANPQKENGFTPISNEILENIMKSQLNGTQFRIILAVWRHTYGFGRKSHEMSDTFLSVAIGVPRQQIAREIKPLIARKIILVIKDATFNNAKIIAFNKDYEAWITPQAPTSITGNYVDASTGNYVDASTGNYVDASTGNYVDAQERNIKENFKENFKDKKHSACAKKKTAIFIPPKLDEVQIYCLERNNSIDAQAFIDFYQSKGWMVGKSKMKDWKAAIRTWERNRKDSAQPRQQFKTAFERTMDTAKESIEKYNNGELNRIDI